MYNLAGLNFTYSGMFESFFHPLDQKEDGGLDSFSWCLVLMQTCR